MADRKRQFDSDEDHPLGAAKEVTEGPAKKKAKLEPTDDDDNALLTAAYEIRPLKREKEDGPPRYESVVPAYHPAPMEGAFTKREENLQALQKEGKLAFKVVENDGSRENYVLLQGLKKIFCAQLPNMPKDYVMRLVFDKKHASVALVKREYVPVDPPVLPGKPITKHTGVPTTVPKQEKEGISVGTSGKPEVEKELREKVIGGICYRPFITQTFAEIVFCAVSSGEQSRGYGAIVMNYFKHHARSIGIKHFFTYADNFAVGYFKKQSFTSNITLDQRYWAGYIKDYEGATLMQCTVEDTQDYLNVKTMVSKQRRVIIDHILKMMPSCSKVYKGFTHRHPVNPFKIPGVTESGWKPSERKETHRKTLTDEMKTFLRDVEKNSHAWPFRHPVNAEEVPDYYQIIKDPVDLETMMKRLDGAEGKLNYYTSWSIFYADLKKMCDNARLFNPEGSRYYKCADSIEKHINALLRERCEEYDEILRKYASGKGGKDRKK